MVVLVDGRARVTGDGAASNDRNRRLVGVPAGRLSSGGLEGGVHRWARVVGRNRCQRWDLERLDAHVAFRDGPLVGLFGQYRPDQAYNRSTVRAGPTESTTLKRVLTATVRGAGKAPASV